jgi:AcrR family transcriptional regulator
MVKKAVDATPKRRGRPREYDAQLALARARDTFWRCGYAATSLDELSRAMEMNRPSLYGAFGDKEALYLKALEGYTETSRVALEATLATDMPLRESLYAVYAGAIVFYLHGKGHARGCFLVSTAVTEAATSARVRQLLTRNFQAFDAAFARRLRAGVERGELAKAVDPGALAPIATAVMHSIALRARAGIARSQLEQLAAAGVALICGAAPG